MQVPLGYENARLRADQLRPGMDVYYFGRNMPKETYRILKVMRVGGNVHVDVGTTVGERSRRELTLTPTAMTDFYRMSPEEYAASAEVTEAVLMGEILDKKRVDVPHMQKYFPKLDKLKMEKEKGGRRRRRTTRRRGKRTTRKH